MTQNISRTSRLLSLDVLRGLTVAAMILVNNPGDWGNIYAPLKHAAWHGCTPTDLIFPFFLFIVGISITFSLAGKKTAGQNSSAIISSILKRSVILFLLGITLALVPDVFVKPAETFATLRIPGVLQRIAIVFLVSALVFYKTGVRTQIVIFTLILVIYWILMSFVPVPGIGEANLDKEKNLGAWLDRKLLTENHLWKLSKTWDPEGILGTFPAVATGISGLLAGVWLRNKTTAEIKKIGLMLLVGVLVTALGWIWGFDFPVNKSLWTSSYVLFTSGLATIFLALLYWLIDIRAQRWLAPPFVIYGLNAITVYFMSTIMAKLLNFIKLKSETGELISLKTHLYSTYFTPFFSPLNASVAWAFSFVLFWLVILWIMYKRNIIIKV